MCLIVHLIKNKSKQSIKGKKITNKNIESIKITSLGKMITINGNTLQRRLEILDRFFYNRQREKIVIMEKRYFQLCESKQEKIFLYL